MNSQAWSATVLAVAALGCARQHRTSTPPDAAPPPPPVDAGADVAPPPPPPPVDATVDAGVDTAVRPPAPPLYNESSLGDVALARAALEVLGFGATGVDRSCAECHGMTRPNLRAWANDAEAVLNRCLVDLSVRTDDVAGQIVACLGMGGMYRAEHAGIFSAGAHLPWFTYVFERGAGPGWRGRLDEFVRFAGMPSEGRAPLTQAEFDLVASWFVRGAPFLDSLVPEEPPPADCVPMVSPEVRTHGSRMVMEGWGARNREAGILMHGCAGATSPEACLASETRAADTTFGRRWDEGTGASSRVLFTTSYSSAFWTRSSADGRFVAHGPGFVVDLQRDVEIPVMSPYDPGFFPDNSAFVWPGVVCEQSLLYGSPSQVTLMEPGCSMGDIGLYEHVGVGLGGGDYWVVTGEFMSDDGGHSVTLEDPRADFSSRSEHTFVRMLNTGSGFQPGGSASAATAGGGDGVISPSSTLFVTRLGGADLLPIGYRLYRLDHSAAPFEVRLRELATYCLPGTKPAFSFDERFLVTHHYINDGDARELGFAGPTDPAFAPYRDRGAANVYLIELATGRVERITNMGPGQYALFPHFRSDGWIYFMVRTEGTQSEHIVASDAFFRM